MFCCKCGRELPEGSVYCSNCGNNCNNNTLSVEYQPPETINTYLIHSILATCFCCVPFGIVAIIYAARANGCVAVKDYNGAKVASEQARKWFMASIWTGVAAVVLYILFFVGIGAISVLN